MTLQRIKLLVSYDGTDFGGWQTQAPGRPTVQGTLEEALQRLFDKQIRLYGSGRTDAGAHALGQVCHFDSPRELSRFRLKKALGRWTPDSIAILRAWQAPPEFHSLFSAQKKTYIYRILNRPEPSALMARYAWWLERPLSLSALEEMSAQLLGRHDFKSFQTRGTELKTTTERIIYSAQWQRRGPHVLEFRLTGSGFLKQMVRNIVGTLVDLNYRGSPPEEFDAIVAARDRRAASATAPAHGLYLFRVYYPQILDNACREI